MRLILLSRLAIVFEVGFILWYSIMAITLWRGLHRQFDAITAGMFFLSAVRLFTAAWMIGLLYLLTAPTAGRLEWLLGIKIILDTVMGAAVTYFMWHLKLKSLLKEWLDGGDPH